MSMCNRGFGLFFAAVVLFGADKTEETDFPAGGTLRLQNSTGELVIEGWD